jgi:galactokinase
VNLIGEHVDYNGGRCLPIALTQTTRARVTRRGDDRLRFTSGEREWTGAVGEQPEGWAAYVGGVLLALEATEGLDVDITSDVPVGAGLSSSAALECAVAIAVDRLLDLGSTPDQLVAASIRAESEFVGAPTGGLDQSIAVHAVQGQALLLDFADDSREQVPFDPTAHGLALLVIDTRVSHELTDGGYGSRRDQAWAAAEELGLTHISEATDEQVASLGDDLRPRARHVVTENARVDSFVRALRADDWAALGPLMDASHESLRTDYEVSCEELDVAVEVAREAGALGARMTGGGFGGSAIALVPVERVAAVRRAVSAAFAARGWGQPAYLDSEPGRGAHVA